MHPYCAACVRSRRRAPYIGALAGVLVLGALGGGGYYAYRTYEPPYDYGRFGGDIRKLEAELVKEPCDRPKMVELEEKVLMAGDNRGVIQRADAFYARCGDYTRLRWLTHRARARLGEWDAAVDDSTKIIEDDPYNASYRVWRGLVHEERGDHEKAVEDYRQALLLTPQLTNVPLNLAASLERLNRSCEAIAPLDQLLYHHPDATWAPSMRARIAELEKRGSCGGTTGGTARLKGDRSSFRASVQIGGKVAGSFVVDTGASLVTLTRPLAEKLGINLASGRKILLHTANGDRYGTFTDLATVEVDGLRSTHVPAVIVDELGPGVDGLLGLSFLSRFDITQSEGVMQISVRVRK